MDIDVVIEIPQSKRQPFVASVEPYAYVDEADVQEAIASGTMFNVIHKETCFKVDFVALRVNDYEQVKFSRKVQLDYDGKKISVISPEDLIISKLMWSKDAGISERQMRDCESILEVNQKKLDYKYLETWVSKLGLTEEFKMLKTQS